MPKIRFRCEKCGAINTFINRKAGDGIVCKDCGSGQRIPEDAVIMESEDRPEVVSHGTGSPGSSVTDEKQEVVITDFDMPMSSMVQFMIKWAIAAIPAAIILGFIGWAAYFVFMIFMAGL